MKKQAFSLLFAVVTTVAVTTPAQATLLSTLINLNGVVLSDGLLFHEFEYLATGDMPDASQINVVPFFDGTDFGIKFQGAFLDLPGGGASDALIDFRVTALDRNCLLTDAKLAGNPTVIGGNGFISVTETFLPDEPNALMNIFAFIPGPSQLADSVSFAAGHKSLHVQKDILARSATIGGGVPLLSFLTQTYHCVPEPTSVTLFGLGLMGIALFRVRRHRSSKAR